MTDVSISQEAFALLVDRVSTLENWRVQRDIADARADEQRKHLDARFDTLQKEIREVNETLKWVNRLIIGGIIAASVSFVIGGGLKSIGVMG